MLACQPLGVPVLQLHPGNPRVARHDEADVFSSERELTWSVRSEQHQLQRNIDRPVRSSQQPPPLVQADSNYTGEQDRVNCTNEVLIKWRPSDNPTSEPKSHLPRCPVVQGDDCGNIPMVYSSYLYEVTKKNKDMKMEENRFETFSSSPLYPDQTPDELARAGFYYYGDVTKPDRVKCAYCQGRLFDWQPGDNPWVEHARCFPGCPYIQLCLGQDCIDDVQRQLAQIKQERKNRKVPSVDIQNILAFECRGEEMSRKRTTDSEIDQAMKSDQVEAVLELGISRNVIEKIVESRIREKGVTFANADDLASVALERQNESDIESSERQGCEVKQGQNIISKTELNERFVCKVCMECQIQVTFVPCGHLVCCGQCALVLDECPICRTAISGVIRTFY